MQLLFILFLNILPTTLDVLSDFCIFSSYCVSALLFTLKAKTIMDAYEASEIKMVDAQQGTLLVRWANTLEGIPISANRNRLKAFPYDRVNIVHNFCLCDTEAVQSSKSLDVKVKFDM